MWLKPGTCALGHKGMGPVLSPKHKMIMDIEMKPLAFRVNSTEMKGEGKVILC